MAASACSIGTRSSSSNTNTTYPSSGLDPVTDLPADLAALCLSFVDPKFLLIAQAVNHAWRKAIDGGLPTIWHTVRNWYSCIKEAELAEVAEKSRCKVSWLCNVSVTTTYGLNTLCSLSILRVLHIKFAVPIPKPSKVRPFLSSFPLLEELSIDIDYCVFPYLEFPTLPLLQTVECSRCRVVKGLRNLPALTSLVVNSCDADASEPWPTSLRKLCIHGSAFDPPVLDRIAALPNLVDLDTDWFFIIKARPTLYWQSPRPEPFLTPPFNQLSFLPTFTKLQRFAGNIKALIKVNHKIGDILFGYLSSMASLRIIDLCGRVYDSDIGCLVHLPNLQSLAIHRSCGLGKNCFSHVAAMPKLTVLYLFDCYSIDDYSPVKQCRQLRVLKIEQNSHRMETAEVQAIASLCLLEVLELHIQEFIDMNDFALVCTMRNLNWLAVILMCNHIPETAFSHLPELSALQELYISRIEDKDWSKLIDYLVQMPELRHIHFYARWIVGQERARLGSALPRLETASAFFFD